MSYVPDLDANGMLSSLGSTIANNVKAVSSKQLLSELGKDLMGGDYQSGCVEGAGCWRHADRLEADGTPPAAAERGYIAGCCRGLRSVSSSRPRLSRPATVGGDYFKKLAAVESGGNPNAVSPTGAKGVFQFIPQHGSSTAAGPMLWTQCAVCCGPKAHCR